MSFFPTGSTSIAAGIASSRVTIPTPWAQIRVTRQNSSDRVFVAFGGSAVAATTDSVELVNDIVEIWQNPAIGQSTYTHMAAITSANTVGVNISVSPLFEV